MAERDVHFIPAQMKKDEWMRVDKIPYCGELLIETGSVCLIKIGDGLRPYRDLPYFEMRQNDAVTSDSIKRIINIHEGDSLDSVPNDSLVFEM